MKWYSIQQLTPYGQAALHGDLDPLMDLVWGVLQSWKKKRHHPRAPKVEGKPKPFHPVLNRLLRDVVALGLVGLSWLRTTGGPRLAADFTWLVGTELPAVVRRITGWRPQTRIILPRRLPAASAGKSGSPPLAIPVTIPLGTMPPAAIPLTAPSQPEAPGPGVGTIPFPVARIVERRDPNPPTRRREQEILPRPLPAAAGELSPGPFPPS
ncbi:MAG: hypothetical protein JO112_07955 [Planctomycetes bacterium]|nr:hypothetical protein [Planctomycetota bacterium]